MERLILKISKDFTKSPGPRDISEGDFSGELFYKDVLKPKYEEAIERDVILVIDLDGTFGYGTSFLEEAFGGLVRDGFIDILKRIEIITEEEYYLEEDIVKYIREAEEEIKNG